MLSFRVLGLMIGITSCALFTKQANAFDRDDLCSALDVKFTQINNLSQVHELLKSEAGPSSIALNLIGDDVDDELVKQVAERFPRLLHLRLSSTTRLSDVGLAIIGTKMSQLRTFWTYEHTNPAFTSDGFTKLLNLHSIENLCFHYDPTNWTREFFRTLGGKPALANFPLLKRFGTFTSKVPKGTDYATLLAEHTPELAYLRLDIPHLTTNDALAFGRLSHLRYLNIEIDTTDIADNLDLRPINPSRLDVFRLDFGMQGFKKEYKALQWALSELDLSNPRVEVSSVTLDLLSSFKQAESISFFLNQESSSFDTPAGLEATLKTIRKSIPHLRNLNLPLMMVYKEDKETEESFHQRVKSLVAVLLRELEGLDRFSIGPRYTDKMFLKTLKESLATNGIEWYQFD